jgi:PAS domain S-box-containing protein
MSNPSFNTQTSLQIVDSIAGLVWRTDADVAIDFFNQEWSEYTGLGLIEAEGRHWIDVSFIHPDELSNLRNSWQNILSSGQPGVRQSAFLLLR